jgi:ankyrin repeat protein
MTGTDQGGRTPLHYAALANDTGTVCQLLAQGASPSAADRHGFTPLHFAAQQRSLAAELLLAAGAEVDAVNQYDNTPLAVAVMNSRGHGELIQLLRHHGADPRHRSNAGQSPAGTARLIANYNIAQFFADLTGPSPPA